MRSSFRDRAKSIAVGTAAALGMGGVLFGARAGCEAISHRISHNTTHPDVTYRHLGAFPNPEGQAHKPADTGLDILLYPDQKTAFQICCKRPGEYIIAFPMTPSKRESIWCNRGLPLGFQSVISFRVNAFAPDQKFDLWALGEFMGGEIKVERLGPPRGNVPTPPVKVTPTEGWT